MLSNNECFPNTGKRFFETTKPNSYLLILLHLFNSHRQKRAKIATTTLYEVMSNPLFYHPTRYAPATI